MSEQLLYQIGLTLIQGIGDVNSKKLVAYCGGPEAVFCEKRKNLEHIPGISQHTLDQIDSKEILKRAEEEIAFISRNHIRPLFYLDADYPKRLKQCVDCPTMLYYKGNADLNATRMVSIVGTRNISDYGKMLTEKIVSELADDNVVIVSGLAYGVDSAAHNASLKHGIPTIGVLGHGLQLIYPAQNRELAERMIDHGGVLTECISGTKPDFMNFPKRNRIIAGMTDCTIVIESALKGGSLITAELANSYDRDVFAFSGRINDTYSQGCNHLISTNKACLIENADNIRYIMQWDKNSKKNVQTQLFREFNDDEQKVMDSFDEENIVNIDKMINYTDFTPTKLASILLTLEFDGILTALPGKRYQKV